jgi:cytochrome c oxidase cbb3-type subunit III
MRTAAYAVAIVVVGVAACDRELREFRIQREAAQRVQFASVPPLYAGQPPAPVEQPDPAPAGGVRRDYLQNAYAMNEGKRLFTWFNCVGCHAHGGGGMGPPLMDDKWLYGAEPEQIFATIVQGRPNGMPSFRGKIPDNQVWQIVAYVRSLSGNVRPDAAPTRNDDMSVKPAEQRTPRQPPVQAPRRQ